MEWSATDINVKSAYIETTKNERPELIEKNECVRKCEKYDIKCIYTLRQWMFSLFRYIHSVFALNGVLWKPELVGSLLRNEVFAWMHTCIYVHLSSLFFSLSPSLSIRYHLNAIMLVHIIFYLFHKLPKCGAQAWTLFIKWFRCRRRRKNTETWNPIFNCNMRIEFEKFEFYVGHQTEE